MNGKEGLAFIFLLSILLIQILMFARVDKQNKEQIRLLKIAAITKCAIDLDYY